MFSPHAIDHRSQPATGGPHHVRRLALAMFAALLAGLAVTGVFSSALERAFSSSPAPLAAANPYAPGQLVVSSTRPLGALVRYIRARTGLAVSASGESSGAPDEQLLRLPKSVDVLRAATRISALAAVRYAVPNYIAYAAGAWLPNDPGTSGKPHGWEQLQWNFMPADGVDAPQAWGNLIADRRPGAKGVTIAVLDSGVAFRTVGHFKRSPDFTGTIFVAPCDLIAGQIRGGQCTDKLPLDHLGHGTFVTGTLAEATNNGFGVTGLAYKASIMPVRVLNAGGAGTSSVIAEGVRYAVQHGAKVINLSLEFPPGTTPSQIPELLSAFDYAHDHGVVLVAAAGNDYNGAIDYPAAAADVIAVGATTKDRCLASYSDTGRALALVAPGGGDDSDAIHSPNCHPLRNLPDVYQMTFPSESNAANAVSTGTFVLQGGWFGTSMAAPDVTAAAAMVIASGVLGPHPTPDAILARLEATARHLGGPVPNNNYGYGLVDIGAATANGGPLTPTTTATTTTPTTTTTTTTTTTITTDTSTNGTTLTTITPPG